MILNLKNNGRTNGTYVVYKDFKHSAASKKNKLDLFMTLYKNTKDLSSREF